MRKAVFLDRDGVINKEVDVLRHIDQLELLSGSGEAISELNKLGYLVIVITNQPVIARGWLTEAQVEEIHGELAKRIKADGGVIDKFYYCPHHPNANLEQYRKVCECRKPNIGMITQAQKDFDIDLKQSFFVGDMTADILVAKNAGVKSVLVLTGYAGKDGKHEAPAPDYTADNLPAAVELIKQLGA